MIYQQRQEAARFPKCSFFTKQVQSVSPQKIMPLWHRDYFELKAIEKKQSQALCPPPICLNTGHKFVKVSRLPSLPGRTEVYHWRQLQTLINPEMAAEKSTKKNLTKQALSSMSSPINLPFHSLPPKSLNPPSSCHSSTKLLSLSRCYISLKF